MNGRVPALMLMESPVSGPRLFDVFEIIFYILFESFQTGWI